MYRHVDLGGCCCCASDGGFGWVLGMNEVEMGWVFVVDCGTM